MYRRQPIWMTTLAMLIVALLGSAATAGAQCEGFFEQPGGREAGVDCLSRPPGSTCLGFLDSFIWLIYDGVAGWKFEDCGDHAITVAVGFKGEYHHQEGTNRVKFVPVDLEATVGGLSPRTVFCRNETTGQRVLVDTQDVSWDCRALGLLAIPGDVVVMGVGGVVEP